MEQTKELKEKEFFIISNYLTVEEFNMKEQLKAAEEAKESSTGELAAYWGPAPSPLLQGPQQFVVPPFSCFSNNILPPPLPHLLTREGMRGWGGWGQRDP